MARLTKQQIAQHQEWLCCWHAPDHMLKYVDKLIDTIGSVDFFTQAGLAFLRDAWAGAKFGVAREATAVRLVGGEWPDFEIEVNNAVELFEFTEADLPERKRGEEYRAASDAGFPIEDDPVEDWEERAKLVPQALMIAVSKKTWKQYSKKVNLLIYLNIDEYGIREREIEASLGSSIAAARECFADIWLLWKDRVYHPD